MIKKIFIFALIAGIFIFFIFILRGQEDTWLCTAEGWVKHGQPSASMPQEECGRQIKNFSECLEAGKPVMESYPRKCQSGDKTFTEDIGNELEKIDLIRIASPRPNTKVGSPLVISGQAVGNWFFEASFPIVLLSAEGSIIAQSYATAQSDWMTENFVEFNGKLEFTAPAGVKSGLLVLKKDNPSGLPENNDQLEVPVFFE